MERKYCIAMPLIFLSPRLYNEAIKAAEIDPIDQPMIDDFFITEDEATIYRSSGGKA